MTGPLIKTYYFKNVVSTPSPPIPPGNTALILACAGGHLGVAEALLDAGAPLEAANLRGV